MTTAPMQEIKVQLGFSVPEAQAVIDYANAMAQRHNTEFAQLAGDRPTLPQKTWRTAWRSLVKEAARQAGREAATEALKKGARLGQASVWRRAASPFARLRFHDLRHQAITKLAENGVSDATLMAVAGHFVPRDDRALLHVRMATNRIALAKLESGLIKPRHTDEEQRSSVVN